MVGTVKKSTDTRLFRWLSRKVRQVCDGWLPIPDQVLANARLADVDAELEQLAVDAWRSPTRILSAHVADEVTDLAWDSRSPGFAVSNLPRPEQPKCIP